MSVIDDTVHIAAKFGPFSAMWTGAIARRDGQTLEASYMHAAQRRLLEETIAVDEANLQNRKAYSDQELRVSQSSISDA